MNQEMKISKEIDDKNKIPKDVRNHFYRKILKEITIAIFINIFFIIMNYGFTKLEQNMLTHIMQGIAGVYILSTIILFEISYRKSNDELAIHGIELTVLSFIVLFMPYVYFRRGIIFRLLYSMGNVFFSIYYAVKALVVYLISVKKYKNTVSDIKEIVNEENESYLDEINERKFDNVDESYDRVENDTVRKRDRFLRTLKGIAHHEKKEEIKDEEKLEVKEDVKKQGEKPKKRRTRQRKKTVQSLATVSRRKKKDGESND